MGISLRLPSRLVIRRATKVLVLHKTKPVIDQYFARVLFAINIIFGLTMALSYGQGEADQGDLVIAGLFILSASQFHLGRKDQFFTKSMMLNHLTIALNSIVIFFGCVSMLIAFDDWQKGASEQFERYWVVITIITILNGLELVSVRDTHDGEVDTSKV